MNPHQRCVEWLVDATLSSNPSSRPSSPHDSACLLPPERKRKRAQSMDHNVDSVFDPQATPQAKRRARHGVDDGTSDIVSLSDASTQDSRNSKRSRKSVSPVKSMNKLYTTETPINEARLTLSELPLEMRTLVQGLERCKFLRGVVPASLKESLRQKYPLQDLWEQDFVYRADSLIDQGSSCDRTPTLREVAAIVKETTDLDISNDLETGWNTHCHGPLLVLARQLSRHEDHIRTANVTHARLFPRYGPSSLGTKMVDFVIGLRIAGSDALSRAYLSLRAEDDGVTHFNHSTSQHINRNPLAISIETKRPDTGGVEAKLQLCIWASAHLRWLADVRRADLASCDHEVYLPFMEAIGSQWYWLLVKGIFDKQGVLQRMTIFEKHNIGDAATAEGVFAILGALSLVIDWAVDTWRPWLEKWLAIGT